MRSTVAGRHANHDLAGRFASIEHVGRLCEALEPSQLSDVRLDLAFIEQTEQVLEILRM